MIRACVIYKGKLELETKSETPAKVVTTVYEHIRKNGLEPYEVVVSKYKISYELKKAKRLVICKLRRRMGLPLNVHLKSY